MNFWADARPCSWLQGDADVPRVQGRREDRGGGGRERARGAGGGGEGAGVNPCRGAGGVVGVEGGVEAGGAGVCGG